MIFKYILLLLLPFYLLAQIDTLEYYQNHGIEALEKKLDQTLASPAFWREKLKDYNVTMGYYNQVNTLLFCNKANTSLQAFHLDHNHTLVKKENLSTFIGQMQGDKKSEGDLKTPEGVYNLVKKLTHVDPFYGPLALVTNYPNTFDRVNNKSGHGIWIHGLPLKGERDTFTKGCLAINNEALVKLAHDINYTKTKLIISPSKLKPVTKEQISILLAQLYQWRNSWKYNDFKTYISYYSPTFIRYDGVTFHAFKRFKEELFSRKQKKRIDFKDISIIPYPNRFNETRFLITFHETYKTRHLHFQGQKELYVTFNGSSFSILSEK